LKNVEIRPVGLVFVVMAVALFSITDEVLVLTRANRCKPMKSMAFTRKQAMAENCSKKSEKTIDPCLRLCEIETAHGKRTTTLL